VLAESGRRAARSGPHNPPERQSSARPYGRALLR